MALIQLYIENRSYQLNYKKIVQDVNIPYKTQGNYFLYLEENGIKSFPFIFGESLYLYSADNDKNYLVDRTKLPLSGYTECMSMQGNKIFYQKLDFLGDGDSVINCIDISNRNSDSAEIFFSNNYVYTKGKFYYADYFGIIEVDCDTNEEKLLYKLKQEYSYEDIRIKDDMIYAYNYHTDCIDAISTITGDAESYRLNKVHEISSFDFGNDDNLFITDSENKELIEYDLKTGGEKVVAKISLPKEPLRYGRYIHEKAGYIYCPNDNYNLLKINCKTHATNSFINILDFMPYTFIGDEEDIHDYNVFYSDDYMAIQISYDGKSFFNIEHYYITTMIFDYEGNFINVFNTKS